MIATLAVVAVAMFTLAFIIAASVQEREDRRREAQMISQMAEQARVHRARYMSAATDLAGKPQAALMDKERQWNIHRGATRVHVTGSERKRAA